MGGTHNETRTEHTPLLQWLFQLMSLVARDEITVPGEFRTQAREVRKLLRNDNSGIVNSMIDYAIKASLVDYTVQTGNENLTKVFNAWLENINTDLRGRVPTGVNPLAKQYFNERWKGSSLCILRTAWEEKDFGGSVGKLVVPTKMWMVKGEDVFVEQGKKVVIGEEKYYLVLGNNPEKNPEHRMLLKTNDSEAIFVQKPFSRWTDQYPVPFLIQRGLYENILFMDMVSNKGQKIISKALEYLLVMKKGTEGLAKLGKPDFIYSEDDLKKIKQDLKGKIIGDVTTKGTPIYATNFDTEMEHMIPDYSKAFSSALMNPIEKKLLAGLGLIEIVEGTASSRKESILNPKPFIGEVNSGIEDFKQLLKDIMLEIIERNKGRKKYMNNTIRVFNTQPKEFIDKDLRDHLRSAYDRGVLSKETFLEVVCDGNYMQELERRKQAKKDGEEEVMFPHIIQNIEGAIEPTEPKPVEPTDETQPEEKTGPEAKNFDKQAKEDDDKKKKNKKKYKSALEYEEAPYKTNKELPDSVKVLPAGGQTIWRKTFNSVEEDNDEETAIKIAWSTVKKVYKKVGDKWVKKSSAQLDKELRQMEVADLRNLKELEVLRKKEQLLDKLLKQKEEDN